MGYCGPVDTCGLKGINIGGAEIASSPEYTADAAGGDGACDAVTGSGDVLPEGSPLR